MSTVGSFRGKTPVIGAGVYLADTAAVLGDVEIGAGSSIWFSAVVRGDVNFIRIGAQTSIQDGCVVHVTTDRYSTTIGDRVTVGHLAMLHGCTVGSRTIIGMGAIVLDGAFVGEHCIVAAGSVVTPDTRLPPGTLALGSPARPKRDLTADELALIEASADHYVELARIYREGR